MNGSCMNGMLWIRGERWIFTLSVAAAARTLLQAKAYPLLYALSWSQDDLVWLGHIWLLAYACTVKFRCQEGALLAEPMQYLAMLSQACLGLLFKHACNLQWSTDWAMLQIYIGCAVDRASTLRDVTIPCMEAPGFRAAAAAEASAAVGPSAEPSAD